MIEKKSFSSQLFRKKWCYFIAKCWLYLPRFSSRIYPACLAVLVYSALSSLGLLQYLPNILQLLLLITGGSAVFYALYYHARHTPFPSTKEAERWLEKSSKLPHHPFTTLQDSPAHSVENNSFKNSATWYLHQAQAQALLQQKKLRVGLPLLPYWPQRAKYTAITCLTIITIAFLWQPQKTTAYIQASFQPHHRIIGLAQLPSYEAWITPPSYTGLGTIPLDVTRQTLSVPQGSIVHFQTTPSWPRPRLNSDGKNQRFRNVATGQLQASFSIQNDTTLTLRSGLKKSDPWQIQVLPDTPPNIHFTAEPKATQRYSLEIAFQGNDDYGLVEVQAVLQLADGSASQPHYISLHHSDRNNAPNSIERKQYLDLTEHAWAGKKVHISLFASDALGQRGFSETFTITLPERVFYNAIAQQLIEIRRHLLTTQNPNMLQASRALREIGAIPESFKYDTLVTLGIRTASNRLYFLHRQQKSLDSDILNTLWQTALRLEEGEVPATEQELRNARKNLEDTLANSESSRAEIQAAFQEYIQALQQYFNAMYQQVQQMNPNQLPASFATPLGLGDMLRDMQLLAESGDREQALKALQNLQQMLENMQMRSQDYAAMREMITALHDLDALIAAQQELFDTTYQTNAEQIPTLAPQQLTLKEKLKTLIENLETSGLGAAPALTEAQQALQTSHVSLKAQDKNTALAAQNYALEKLREGLEEAGKELQRQAGGQMFNLQMMPGNTLQGMQQLQEHLKIPDNTGIGQTRQILELLRERVNDAARSRQERDYIRQLLETF